MFGFCFATDVSCAPTATDADHHMLFKVWGKLGVFECDSLVQSLNTAVDKQGKIMIQIVEVTDVFVVVDEVPFLYNKHGEYRK